MNTVLEPPPRLTSAKRNTPDRNGSLPEASAQPPLDVCRIKSDFPILHRPVHGRRLVYLDNAATTQKPHCVIDAVSNYYETANSNVHRGLHLLSERATQAFENARVTAQEFINAQSAVEIIFTRGTTESVNLVAQSFGRANITAGDEIIISHMEHHSNIVPWQILCQQTGAILRVIPIDENGDLIIEEFERLIGPQTKLVSIVHLSNSLGTINPVHQIVETAHRNGVPVFIDGAQAVARMPVDVQALGCDFYAFSGHKIYGPTGIGVLYGKKELLESMPPYQGGGDMISSVTFEKTTYNALPHKFEAGTPNIADAIGLAAALGYVSELGLENIAAHEEELLRSATRSLQAMPGVNIIGTAEHKSGVLSFTLDGIHPHDIGQILDGEGIAVRAGHHCCQPVMDRYGLSATARASFGVYNTQEDIAALVEGVKHVQEVFT